MTTCWPLANLGDHIDLFAGFAFKSRDFTEETDDIRLLRGANIGQGSLKWEQDRRWPRSRAADHSKFELAADDIVLAMDRPWIEAGLKWSTVRESDLPMLLVQRVARLRASGSLSQDYLRCLIGSPQFEAYVRPIVTGVNVPHISPTQIRDFSFGLPPPDAQDSVTGLLRPMDDLIDNNRRRIEILEKMSRLLYREWFMHFRYPGHEDVEFVDSGLGPIPEGWDVPSVRDVANLVRGRSYRRQELVEDGGLPFLNLKCIDRGGGFRKSGLKRYDGKFKETQQTYPGDTVIAMTDMTQERNIVGQAGRVPSLDTEFGIISLDLARVVPVGSVDSDYLYGMFRFSTFSETVKEHANGTNVLHLSPDCISEYRFTMPPARLQHLYREAVNPMLLLMDNLMLENEALGEARDLLLPRLVSGELDVSELDLGLVAV